MLLGIDPGNKKVKVVTKMGAFSFDSCLGDGRERRLETEYPDQMIGEYDGQPFFAGMLAERESYFPRRSMGLSKAHDDAKLRILIAIHRFSTEYENKIVVGQPIKMHKPEEKKFIKEMLRNEHTLTLNGIKKTFRITLVEVSAEGAGAFFCKPQKTGIIRIVDVGSGTVNIATVRDGRFVDRESDTLAFGTESHGGSISDMTYGILASMSKMCKRDDDIRIVGGPAEHVQSILVSTYPNCTVLRPMMKQGEKAILLHSEFANALGFYNLAKAVYGDE